MICMLVRLFSSVLYSSSGFLSITSHALGATFKLCSFVRNVVDDVTMLFSRWVRKLRCCASHLARYTVRRGVL